MYDYKDTGYVDFTASRSFQFKHCTIIRSLISPLHFHPNLISIQALYDYKSASEIVEAFQLIFQFKHCTIIRNKLKDILGDRSGFQFKHCTIIRLFWYVNKRGKTFISIQALYDYKVGHNVYFSFKILFQFKHCTIIRYGETFARVGEYAFQFKHCTIIRIAMTATFTVPSGFQFKHCTIIRLEFSVTSRRVRHFNSSIVRL